MDTITTRPTTDEYRSGWDRIWNKRETFELWHNGSIASGVVVATHPEAARFVDVWHALFNCHAGIRTSNAEVTATISTGYFIEVLTPALNNIASTPDADE